MSRKALGRGLRALIPEAAAPESQMMPEVGGQALQSPEASPIQESANQGAETASGRLCQVSIDRIRPNPRQPRTEWEPDALEELTRSIISAGLLEPIILRPVGEHYEIVAGERRWRACKIAGWNEIPALVRTLEDHESLEAALIENVQRTDLNPVEEARAYRTLSSDYSLTHDEIAQRVGKDRSTITNLLRILNLSDAILEHVLRGTLSLGHARVLLGVPEEYRDALALRIIDESWSVRKTEAWVKGLAKGKDTTRRRAVRGPVKTDSLRTIEEDLCRHFSTEVRLRLKGQGGTLEIGYHDDEDLSRILDLLGIIVT